MKKSLLLFSVFISLTLTTALHAQNDMALQTAEGSMMAHDYQSAESNFSKYIASVSAQLPAYLNKVASYDTCGAFQKEALFPNFSINHKWSKVFYERGMERLDLKNTDSAMADFEMAIKIDNTNAEAYYQAALIKKEKGDKTGSCIYIGKALAINDTMKKAKDAYTMGFCWMCAETYYKKGETQVDLKEYRQGITNLNLAILICHDSASYYAYRGAAYDGLGKTDSALADYSKAIKLDSNNITAYYHRALAYEAKQKYQDAFNDFTKIISMSPNDVDAYIHRAGDCESMDKEASAEYDYEQVIRLKPDYGQAYYKVALYKQKIGQPACSYFQKAADLGVDDAQPYADQCKQAEKKADRMR